MNRYLLLGALLVAGCGTKDEATDSAGDAYATELWDAIDGWDGWDQQDPWTGIQPSADGTHGAFVDIYLNPAAISSFTADEADVGAIVVKKGHDTQDGSSPRAGLTVMEKTGDGTTGWYWARFGDDGTVEMSGEPDGCTGCHSSGSDYRRMVTDSP